MTKELEEFLPEEGEENDSPFLDPTAQIVGEVEIEKNASLFPGSIVDGDDSEVNIREGSIIMNKALIKAAEDNPVSIGKRSFISHGARLEGCNVEKNALIGMDAVVMEGAVIGEDAIVGTNAIVPEGMKVPEKRLVLGQPAEIVREVSEDDLEKIAEIRSTLIDKREEFKMIEKRGKRFDVFDIPKRPEEILEESEVKKNEMKDIPDLENIREELKKMGEDNHVY